uniref:Uncharacterized protein LOC105036961 n=1 Tax=Elaeis guineensis var. tenera TaxID=51953 RepID=A0A8N4EZH3_ELAGV|nr:uncharacterized protein LOC105036961 [Elaeis guineensis]
MVVRVPAGMVPRRPMDFPEAATRRGMAIRRIGVEREEDEGRRSERELALFATARGDTLFTRSWAPVSVQTNCKKGYENIPDSQPGPVASLGSWVFVWGFAFVGVVSPQRKKANDVAHGRRTAKVVF